MKRRPARHWRTRAQMLTLARCQLEDRAQAMSDVFVIRNQLGHYWGKGKAWVDGSQPRLVQRTPHRDEAVNTLFELSSKDVDLRGEVVAAGLSERGEPLIEPSQVPLPLEPTAEEAGDTGGRDASATGEGPAKGADAESAA